MEEEEKAVEKPKAPQTSRPTTVKPPPSVSMGSSIWPTTAAPKPGVSRKPVEDNTLSILNLGNKEKWNEADKKQKWTPEEYGWPEYA